MRIDCKHVWEHISAYIDGEVNAELRAEIDRLTRQLEQKNSHGAHSALEHPKRPSGGKITMLLQDTFWGARFGSLVDRFGVQWNMDEQLR